MKGKQTRAYPSARVKRKHLKVCEILTLHSLSLDEYFEDIQSFSVDILKGSVPEHFIQSKNRTSFTDAIKCLPSIIKNRHIHAVTLRLK